MWKEFREFAVSGNVVDLAVGVIIGVALGKIVESLVQDIIMPPIGLLLRGVDFANLFIVLREGETPGPYATLEVAKKAGAVTINAGVFINTLINFLIVAVAIFAIVKAINQWRRERAVGTGPATPSPSELLLAEIRDLLRR